MIPGLSSLTGGGGLSAGGGGPSTATGGDTSSVVNFDFTSNNAFNLGGSGESSQAAATGADKSSSGSNTLLYVAIGAAVLIGSLYIIKK